MLYLNYFNNNIGKDLYSDDPFIIHLNNIVSEESLMDSYAEQMKCYYFGPQYYGKNWDALYDCLGDFSWISQNHVVIIHSSLQEMDLSAKKIYFEIVFDTIKNQIDWIEKGNKSKVIDFVFDERDKKDIEKYMSLYKKSL